MNVIKDGIWPTMLTPFRENYQIDYDGLESLIEWYHEKQIDGLFAVCQSSEMFFLSLQEKKELMAACTAINGGRVPIVAAGTTSGENGAISEEVQIMAEAGADAVVLLTNSFAKTEESEESWKESLGDLLTMLPDTVRLGLYECPYPYKRVLEPETLAWCAGTGRFDFYKDTCCDIEIIRKKLTAAAGTNLKLYNANSATLLESIRAGCAGYSGVMANFHPDLYSLLYERYQSSAAGGGTEQGDEHSEQLEFLQNYLGFASLAERQVYPTNAKYFLSLDGVQIAPVSRKDKETGVYLSSSQKAEIQQFYAMNQKITELVGTV
ncbi:MAG: dihydrodipicolinate synthase family protein [Spirochaetia bacterium]|nr:dihydrodipicolinate synthase family protein [Spirochaetia bacterium]